MLEREVYKVVKDAARKGIWLRDIKEKLGSLSQTQLTKFLKSLEQKRLVKQISSVTVSISLSVSDQSRSARRSIFCYCRRASARFSCCMT